MALDFGSKNDLKDNEMMIYFISAFKTKTNKTCVHFAYKKKTSTDYEKGLAIHGDAWFDNIDVFDKCPSEPKEVKARYEYVERNNGTAYISLTDICI